jgi:hypothetical protein
MLSGTPLKGSAKKSHSQIPQKSDDKAAGFQSAFKTLLSEFIGVNCDYT